MPPKRPAAKIRGRTAARARVLVAAGKAKAKPKAAAKAAVKAKAKPKIAARARTSGTRRQALRAAAQSANARLKRDPRTLAPKNPAEWVEVDLLKEDTFDLTSTLHLEVWYGGEVGEIAGTLEQLHADRLGRWYGVKVLGSMLASVRDWKRANPGEVFYCCHETTPMDKRASAPGVGYILRAKILTHEKDWTSNALEDPPPPVESDQLRKAAERFGFPQHALPSLAPLEEAPQKKESAKPSSSKKKRGKRKVKEMLEKARWKIEGTPLDPEYRRPIKLGKTKRKKRSSSSRSSSDSGTPSSGSSEVLQAEHRLRKIAQRLPGYLCRKASKEAATILSQNIGEGDWSVGVYRRYYRQILLPKVGSKAILREMMTLCSLLDTLLDGHILTVADLAAQRLKSLELLASGSPVELAHQLEIIPKEMSNLAGQEEARYAQQEFRSEVKLQKQLKGAGKWNPGGKDNPPRDPGQLKGKFGKGGQGKGGKAPHSKVTEVKD